MNLIWLSVGISIGALWSVTTGNPAMLALGVAIGVALSILMRRR